MKNKRGQQVFGGGVRGKNKKGQQVFGLSFGVIFSIFLIVVFIVIAFIAVGAFLGIWHSSDVGFFYRDLQKVVDDAMRGQSSEVDFPIDLPRKIESVCFANLSARITNKGAEYEAIRDYDVYDANVFLVPPEYGEGMEWKNIEHLDLGKITEIENPYCVSAKGELRIGKGFYDKLVWVE